MGQRQVFTEENVVPLSHDRKVIKALTGMKWVIWNITFQVKDLVKQCQTHQITYHNIK